MIQKQEYVIDCFIKTFGFLFSLSTEFESIKKETTSILQRIATINNKLLDNKDGGIREELKHDIDSFTKDLSKCYRMLPFLRNILLGNTVFKNREVISIVKQITEMFQIHETEQWISKNISEINSFIRHRIFDSIKSLLIIFATSLSNWL